VRLRSVWRVARWEAYDSGAGLDRRALTLAAVSVVALALLVPLAASVGPAPGDGLYRVGIAADSPYLAPAEAAPAFTVVAPDARAFAAGRLDLLVRGDRVQVQDTRLGRAAAGALQDAVRRYDERQLRSEPDQAAAFPVTVQLHYVSRPVDRLGGGAGSQPGGSTTGTAGGPTTSPASAGGPASRSTAAGGGAGTAAAGGTTASASRPPATATGGGTRSGENAGGLTVFGWSLFPQGAAGTPSAITPPFPFASLVLAFAFVVPMNFVVQAYASSVLHDRGNRRGEPLLVAPVSTWSLVVGKALPYFVLMLAIAAATAVGLGAGPLAVYAVAPVALVFLAGGFLAGLLARSHKELTFVLVAVSVVVTTFVFVPAIFVDVHPIAAISPLTLVVEDLQGTPVGPATVAFSTLPAFVAAAVCFGLGGGLYREEDLFAQKPLPAKALDALAAFVTRPARAGWASLLSIPFVFLAELLAVALLFVVPLGVALPLLFAAIAAIEELAKSLPAYAGFARGRFDRSRRTVALVGLASGVGFFAGEKLAATAQLVGLFDLHLGRIAFQLGAGVGGAYPPAVLAALLVAPLFLHVGTATLTAAGASRDRRWYLAALSVAILVHVGYNLAVVATLG